MNTLRAIAIAVTVASSFVACADDATETGDEQNITLRPGGQLELYRSEADGAYRFRLEAANGQIIATGEGYTGRAGVMAGVEVFDLNGKMSNNYNIFQGNDDQWYWNLKSGNNEIIAQGGEGFSSRSSAKRSVNTVVGYLLAGVELDNWSDMCGAELFEGANDQLYFRVRANNGRIIVRSEGYTTEASGKGGIDAVIANGGDDARYELKEAQNGAFYFNLEAGNGEIIATSGMYQTEAGAENGIEVLKRLVGEKASCTTENPSQELQCGYAAETPLPDDTNDLRPVIISTVRVDETTFDALDQLARDQARSAVLFHFDGEDDDDFLRSIDDDYANIHRVEWDGQAYDWVEFASGDTEIGVIFDADTLDTAATIGDQSIFGCD